MYINKQKDFDNFLKKAKKYNAIAIDTEFIRDSTYFPKLCLLQLAIDNSYAIVDPFKVDITNLKNIFTNNNIVKVFHAPRQDLEILLHTTSVLPKPLFDTQLAASFIGYPSQIGYGNLVSADLSTKLKKGDSFTDWSIRPLKKSQIKYAKEDVTYLLQLYYSITKKLKKLGRLSWVEEDVCNKFLDKSLYEVSIENRYIHLKRATYLKGKQLACAKEVAMWREKLAIKKNIPRKWVLDDEFIFEICKILPNTLDQLYTLRGVKSRLSIKECRSLLKAINSALSYSTKDLEKLKEQKNKCIIDQSQISEDMSSVVDIMTALVKIRANENSIAPQIICTNSDLKKIILNKSQNLDVLKGWRYKIVGKELLDLLDGKISVYIKCGKVVFKCRT